MSSRRKQFKPKSAMDVVEGDGGGGAEGATDKSSQSAQALMTAMVNTCGDDGNERKRKRSTSDAEDEYDEDESESHHQPAMNNNDTMNDIDELDELDYERLNNTTGNEYESHSASQAAYSQLNSSVMLLMFKCKVCGKGFKHRRSLNRHVKLHSGEKNFKCPFCTTAFARSDHLKAHIRTHNNSKPYRCQVCQCGYSTQAALKVHIAHHHSKSKFKCVLCNDLEFHSQLALEGHMYTNHSKENETADLNELISETATMNPTLVSVDESLTRSKLTDINNLIKHEDAAAAADLANCDLMPINMTISPTKSSANQPSHVTQILKQQQQTYCDVCSVRFSNTDSYLSHMRTCHNLMAKSSLHRPNNENELISNGTGHMTEEIDADEHYDSQDMDNSQLETEHHDQHDDDDDDDTIENSFGSQLHTNLNYSKQIKYECSQCRVSVFKLNDYLRHIKQEHCVEVYRCVLCKQMQLFDNVNLLKEHFFQVHQSLQTNAYKCRLCAHVSPSVNDMAAHLKSAHNQPLESHTSAFRCSYCDLEASSAASLAKHVQYMHSNNNSSSSGHHYSCQYCRNTFNNKPQLERHMRIHLSSIDLKCNICDRQFENKHQLGQHQATHSLATGVKVVTCSFCHQPIENESHFKEHFKRHNNIGSAQSHAQTAKMAYTCVVCRHQLTSNSEYLTHMKSHLSAARKLVDAEAHKKTASSSSSEQASSAVVSACPLSPATTASSSSSSSSSYSSSCPKPAQPFMCELCSSKFDSNLKLQTHLLLKHEYGNQMNVTYSCPVCDEAYNRADLLLQHTQIHGHAAKIYKCSQCSVAFVFKSQLINHSFAHQTKSVSPASTAVAAAAAAAVSALTATATNKSRTSATSSSILHQQLTKPIGGSKALELASMAAAVQSAQSNYVVNTNANGQKTFTCLTCSKTFANQRNLNVHMRIHTGFRPFECDICNRKFTRRENLRSHMKCHLNLRPFTCSICNRSFRRKSHVSSHIEVHFKSKVHNCIECEQQFDQLDTFLAHLIGEHNIYDKELLLLIKSKQILDLGRLANLDYEYVVGQPSGSPASMSLSSKPCAQQSVAHNAIPPLHHYQNLRHLINANGHESVQESKEFEDEDAEQTMSLMYQDGEEDEEEEDDGEQNGLVIEDGDYVDDEDELGEHHVNSVNMNGDSGGSDSGDLASEHRSPAIDDQQVFVDNEEPDGDHLVENDDDDDDYDLDQSIDYTD